MMSPPRMGNLSATLAVIFLLSALSAVLAHSDLPQLALDNHRAPDQLPESDPQSASSTEIPLSNPKPQSEDSEIVSLVEFKPQDAAKTIDLGPLTVIDFPLVNRHWPGRFRHRRGCGHRRRFKQEDRKREISYGNDMIAPDERTGLNSEISSVEFDPHQHGPRFVSLDEAEFKGPRDHQRHHDDNDDEQHGLKSFQKFSWVYADKHTPRELESSHDHDDDDEHEHMHKHKHGFLKKIKKLFDDHEDDDDDEHYKHGHGPHGHHQKRPPFHDREEDGEEDEHQHHHRRHGHDHHDGGLMIMQRLRKFLDHF